MKKLLLLIMLTTVNHFVFAQEDGLSEKQLKEITAVLLPIQQNAGNSLKGIDEKMFIRYQSDMESAAKITDPKKQEARLNEIKKTYYSFIKQGWSAAKVDEKKAQASVLQILKGTPYKVNFGEFLSVTGTGNPPANPPAPTGPECILLHCPMDAKNTTHDNRLAAFGSGTVKDCYAKANSNAALISYGLQTTAIGKNVTVPGGISKVEVSCKTDYDLNGWALAFMGGFSYAFSEVGLQYSLGQSVQSKNVLKKKWVIAPAFFFINYGDNAAAVTMTGSFKPHNNGGEYRIQLYARTHTVSSGAIVPASATAIVEKFSPVKVCFVK